MDDLDGFKEALGADIVIPLAEPGALSITDALGLRSWYDARMDALRHGQEEVQHHSPLG